MDSAGLGGYDSFGGGWWGLEFGGILRKQAFLKGLFYLMILKQQLINNIEQIGMKK